jgi:hypothetical protein
MYNAELGYFVLHCPWGYSGRLVPMHPPEMYQLDRLIEEHNKRSYDDRVHFFYYNYPVNG